MIRPRLKKYFWRKMVVTNCLFLLFVVAIFTGIRYRTTIAAIRNAAEDVLVQYANTNTSQFQLIFDDMSRLTLNLAVSDLTGDILRSANTYHGSNNYFESAQAKRRQLMNMMQQMAGPNLVKSSISILSAKGDYVLLDVYPSLLLSRNEMQELSRLDQFQGKTPYKLISKSEADSYGRTDTPMFSYARKISDEYRVLGYVEYQKPASDLDAIFCSSSETFQMVSLVAHGEEWFYLSDPQFSDPDILLPALRQKEPGQAVTTVSLEQGSYLVYHTSVPGHGFDIYTLLPESYYTQRVWGELKLLIAQSILLLLSMLFFILLISKQIYKPVRNLRHKIEHLELDNIRPGPELSEHADEIELFNHVFAEMVARIKRQNDQLLQQKIRELQVSYRALQAQVSPHFLYNTLYLIGLKGEEHEVPEILDMCSCLTHMMGYCVDLKNDQVPLSRELEYMNNYLLLMKYRYLDKLEYELDIEESVKTLPVPKFILQPLIENCFTHGFKNCGAEKYRILFSLKQAKDTWTLLIEDNGNGFSPEEEERVQKDIGFVQQSIEHPNAKFVSEITGIGLINTYARLFISFSKQVTLRVGTSRLSGGLVEITCPIVMDSRPGGLSSGPTDPPGPKGGSDKWNP